MPVQSLVAADAVAVVAVVAVVALAVVAALRRLLRLAHQALRALLQPECLHFLLLPVLLLWLRPVVVVVELAADAEELLQLGRNLPLPAC